MRRSNIISCSLILFTVFALLLTACSSGGQVMDGEDMVRSYTQISQDEAKEMMEQDDGHVIVDVRKPDEFAAGHIPEAICVPNETIESEQPEELPDLDQVILIYCRSGNRSKQAAQKLFDMGYTNVYEFGGIIDWTGEIVTEESEMQEMRTATETPVPTLVIEVNGHIFYAEPEDNSSADALIDKLSPGEIELQLHDYGGFEKVGPLPWDLPRNDESVSTVPGDVILYQGNQITIYYDENTWDFTRLAKIEGVTKEELLDVFGEGDVSVKLCAEWSE